MDLEQLQAKYLNVPQELKNLKRWVCWTKELRDGKETKVPVNAITGEHAKSDDKMTWTSFFVAVKGCIKYNCVGLGFQLGDGIFGIDLDNHVDSHTGKKPMTEDQFKTLADEFVNALNSYSEYSQSGEGIHIICYGTLPDGRKRKNNVEMYDRGRFFAFTGNVINQKPIEERTKEIIPLWSKYVDDASDLVAERQTTLPISYKPDPTAKYDFGAPDLGHGVEVANYESALTDTEVVQKASRSRTGGEFISLYNGDMSAYNDDHSSADMALCSHLAFWTNGNKAQIDRIFRTSKLIRPKWDQKRGRDTYGNITIENAIKHMQAGYQPEIKQSTYFPATHQNIVAQKADSESVDNFMNIDENGEPIFRIKIIVKDYEYTDTGNAERFYDYFGDIFKYNKDDKMFMFWTGKTWVHDIKDIIRKYANKLLEIMQNEANSLRQDLLSANATADENGEISDDSSDKAKAIQSKIVACEKNITRMANKAGKDAMLAELQSIHDIPCRNVEFDKDGYKLNTDSGIVDLKTGKIEAFDKNQMLSKNTGVKVSFEEPKEWVKFLHGIFDRGSNEQAKNETEEIISCLQSCLGYSLTGSTREQVMFLMYGSGSNGKSTFAEEMAIVMGDYGKSIDSNLLMAQGTAQNTSIQFSLAELIGARYLVTKETDEGSKLAEGTVKALTGSDQINAQQKFGRPFQFMPEFKLWMMTNNLPIIRGTDFGIWRRIFLFPFLKHFTDAEKDMDLPEKLKAESDRILGWCIQGYLKYAKEGGLIQPKCLQEALLSYKNEMDVVAKFILRECTIDVAQSTPAKDMYDAFKSWAFANNEYALRESKFSIEMEKKGYKLSKNTIGLMAYRGIGLLDYVPNSTYGSNGYNFKKDSINGYDD